MKAYLFLSLLCVCMESFGSTIQVKGHAHPLEYHNGMYYWPINVPIALDNTNLLIARDGLNLVCFLSTAPEGTKEQISIISIIVNGFITKWNCFPYKTTVYEVRP